MWLNLVLYLFITNMVHSVSVVGFVFVFFMYILQTGATFPCLDVLIYIALF